MLGMDLPVVRWAAGLASRLLAGKRLVVWLTGWPTGSYLRLLTADRVDNHAMQVDGPACRSRTGLGAFAKARPLFPRQA